MAVLSTLLLSGSACAAEPPGAIQPCVACHGSNGIAVQPHTPHLNGQLPVFLKAAMQAYADGSRPTAVDQHKTFPEQEIEAMAQHYAGQAAARPKQDIDPALVARGETLYGNRCAECHGDAGRESDKDAPLVAAQDKTFMAAQALLFKRGARKFPFMMDDAYRGLSEADLTAIAEFFAAQEPIAPPGNKKKKRK